MIKTDNNYFRCPGGVALGDATHDNNRMLRENRFHAASFGDEARVCGQDKIPTTTTTTTTTTTVTTPQPTTAAPCEDKIAFCFGFLCNWSSHRKRCRWTCRLC